MNDKPPLVKLVESLGYKVFIWNDPKCFRSEWHVRTASGIGVEVEKYFALDGAALELLKVWRKGDGLRAVLISMKTDGLYEVNLVHNGTSCLRWADSLAQAICLALVAAAEKGEGT